MPPAKLIREPGDQVRTDSDRNGTDGHGSTVEVPRIRPRDPVGKAVLAALATALARIRTIEGDARRGDVDGIHRLRTTTRRLRSELRAFRDLLDPEWTGPIEAELKWLAGLLGDVRDLDVLTTRFRKAAGVEPGSEPEALAPLLGELTARHTRALRSLRKGLQGDRYRELLATLQRAIDHPRLADEAGTPCRAAMPPLAASAWRRLRKDARALRPSDPDECFHQVRKRAKRARYTAEMVAPVLGGSRARGARRFIRRATRIQDILGEHQDAVVAAHELEELLGRHGDNPAFAEAARRLLDGQAEAARDARHAFFGAWEKLDRKKARQWLKSTVKAGSP